MERVLYVNSSLLQKQFMIGQRQLVPFMPVRELGPAVPHQSRKRNALRQLVRCPRADFKVRFTYNSNEKRGKRVVVK